MVFRDITPELQERAKNEINEDPARISSDLNNIREWLTTQSHLQCRTDEQWLLAFLRGCKYDLEKTKMKLDNFYTTRSLIPIFFKDRDPLQPEIQEVLKAGYKFQGSVFQSMITSNQVILPLPTPLEPNGPRIFISYMPDIPDKKVNITHFVKVYFMFLDLMLLEDDNTTIAGTFTLCDLNDFPLRYILQVTPGLIKKYVYCIQDCYPIRIKQMHCTRAPTGVETLFYLMKSFLSKKLKKRFFVYGKKKSKKLCNILPKQYLLKEDEGDNGSRDEIIEYWKNKMESYRDWFLEDEKYRSIEKLRSKKPRTLASVFGIADSFNNLNID